MTGRYCVIIPAFDAMQSIGALVRGVRDQHLDVVVVNDGSKDRTAHAASANGALVISHLHNLGKGAALQTGFRHTLRAGYEGVITMDSDGQHDPADLGRFIEAAQRDGVGVVVGNRMGNDRAMPFLRRWTNRVMSGIVSQLIRQRVPDSQCGFRFIRREVLAAIPLEATHFDIETELLLAAARGGWRLGSVPILTIYGNHHSHIRPVRDGLRFMWVVLRYLVSRRKSLR